MRAVPALNDVYLGGVSVLLVDDCEFIRATVAQMLEHYGATVTAVASADQALEALMRERPDVLVSDLAMPDKGGYCHIGKPVSLKKLAGVVALLALKAPSPSHE